jgi:hypothetical protein
VAVIGRTPARDRVVASAPRSQARTVVGEIGAGAFRFT